MREPGAVRFQERDDGAVAADPGPDRMAHHVHRDRHLYHRGAELGEAMRRRLHLGVDVGLGIGMAEAFLHHADAQALGAAVERLHVVADLDVALARVEPVRSGDDLEQQRVVGDGRGHRPGDVDRDFERRDARIGHEPEGRLEADDAAMVRRDADRACLIAADRHLDLAGRDQRGRARRGAAGRVAGLARIEHRAGRAGMAAARHAVIFAHRLPGDLAAGVENARDDGRVDLRHVAFKDPGADHHRHAGEAYVVLQRDALAGELAASLCRLIEVVTYQAP